MKSARPAKNTPAEKAYIRDLRRRSAFELVDAGQAQVLSEDEYPEPVQRFLRRERRMVHVHLSLAARRRLEHLSRDRGISIEELAKEWLEQDIARGRR